jgi:hypothetical protein
MSLCDSYWPCIKTALDKKNRVGRWITYPFIRQMLRGTDVKDVLTLARKHFADMMT